MCILVFTWNAWKLGFHFAVPKSSQHAREESYVILFLLLETQPNESLQDLKGSGCGACCASWCCACCELVQTHRELDYIQLSQKEQLGYQQQPGKSKSPVKRPLFYYIEKIGAESCYRSRDTRENLQDVSTFTCLQS